VSFLTHRLTAESLDHKGRQVVSAAKEIAAKLP
jgi:IclR family acetate operon transcriptional repressor